MEKLIKGVVKFSVAAATVGGLCYVFKDKIKQSKYYQEYDVDTKIDKVKTSIKDKLSAFEDEADIIEDDEIIFEDMNQEDSSRDYVSLDTDSETPDSKEAEKETEAASSADSIEDAKETEETE